MSLKPVNPQSAGLMVVKVKVSSEGRECLEWMARSGIKETQQHDHS